VLFCPGIPGAGKTMIVSTVVDYLKDRFGDDDVGIAFVYYIHGRRYEQKPIDIYASILKQLVQVMATLPDAVSKLYDLHFGLQRCAN
jgi:Cdc6-like AAA superfamily ATPase